MRLTAVSDPHHGGFTAGSSPVSWGSIDELFVNLTVPLSVVVRRAGRGGGGVIDVDLGGSSTGCSWPAAPRRARTNNGRLTSCGGRSRSTAAVHLCALWLLVRAAVTLTAGRRSGDTTGRGA